MGLAGETGEFCDKLKKRLRGDPDPPSDLALINELGDALWYLTSSAMKLGYRLESVMYINTQKGDLRRQRQTVLGNGDDR